MLVRFGTTSLECSTFNYPLTKLLVICSRCSSSICHSLFMRGNFLWKLWVALCFGVFPLVQKLSSNLEVPLESEIVLGKSFPHLSANTLARMLARTL